MHATANPPDPNRWSPGLLRRVGGVRPARCPTAPDGSIPPLGRPTRLNRRSAKAGTTAGQRLTFSLTLQFEIWRAYDEEQYRTMTRGLGPPHSPWRRRGHGNPTGFGQVGLD